jgi:hypothetical protein
MRAFIRAACPCGQEFETTEQRVAEGRGKFCSKACMYAFRSPRPSGLTYNIVAVNRGWHQKGEKPWNAGIQMGPNPAHSERMRGRRLSPATEFQPGQSSWTLGLREDQHPAWKGDDVGYVGVHAWVVRQRGKAMVCEACGSRRNVDWSNVSGEYRRDLSDWQTLCRKCHSRYDRDHIPGAGVRKMGRRCASI